MLENERGSRNNSIKITLEISPSMAVIFGVETSRWYIHQREVNVGTMLGDMLTLYALNYPGFRKLVFDPANCKINERVQITLNGILIDPKQITEKELRDEDRITVIPAYTDQNPLAK